MNRAAIGSTPVLLFGFSRRDLIENALCKLREFKRIALRPDKTDQSSCAIIQLAAAVMSSR